MASTAQLGVSKQGDAEIAETYNSSAAPEGTPVATVLACILVLTEDFEPFLTILKKLTGDLAKPEQVNTTATHKSHEPSEQNDGWLHHNEAAQYLGISKSTLYRYAEQERIECRKLGNRLEYRRTSLDKFKEQHVRPARRSPRGIITPTLGSGK